jgi:transcriptional regulator with XRE-family HTH domain
MEADRASQGFPILGTFSEKLNFLCKTIHPPNRGPYTLQEIADAVGVSPGYIHALRHGKKDQPTLEVIQKLADFFGIPAGAFFRGDKEAIEVAADVEVFVALRDAEVRNITLRAARYSPEERQALTGIMDQVSVMLRARRAAERRTGSELREEQEQSQ